MAEDDNYTVAGALYGTDGQTKSPYSQEPEHHYGLYDPGFNYSDYENYTDYLYGNLTYPLYYALPYKLVGCIFVTFILIVGLIGNTLVVIVVARTRSMHTTTNCYLVSLAIADILVLVSAPLVTIVEFFLIIDQWFLGKAGCSIMVFIQYLGINASALSITMFTVERYIAICHPMKAQTMCTVKRAKRIIAGLWVFSICYNAPWLGLTTTREKYYITQKIELCTFKLARSDYLVVYMADFVIFYIFPLLLTSILYGLIGRILYNRPIAAANGKKVEKNGVRQSNKSKVNGKPTSNSRVQVIKMLAVVVGMFAVLWMPYRFFVVYNSFATTPIHDLWFRLFCRLMVYMNSAINPILYNAMSVKFRRAFKRHLYCGKENQPLFYQSMYTQVSHVAPSVTSPPLEMK